MIRIIRPRLRGARNSEIAHTSATSTDAVEGSTASIKIRMIRWQLAKTAKTKTKDGRHMPDVFVACGRASLAKSNGNGSICLSSCSEKRKQCSSLLKQKITLCFFHSLITYNSSAFLTRNGPPYHSKQIHITIHFTFTKHGVLGCF